MQEANVHHTCGEGETGRGDVNLTLLRIQCFNGGSRKPVPTIIYNFTAHKRGVLWIVALNTRCVHSPQWPTDIVWLQSNRYVAQIWLRRTSSASINPAAGEISTHSDDGTRRRNLARFYSRYSVWRMPLGLIARTTRLNWHQFNNSRCTCEWTK